MTAPRAVRRGGRPRGQALPGERGVLLPVTCVWLLSCWGWQGCPRGKKRPLRLNHAGPRGDEDPVGAIHDVPKHAETWGAPAVMNAVAIECAQREGFESRLGLNLGMGGNHGPELLWFGVVIHS